MNGTNMKNCPHCGGARYRRNIITGGLMTCPTCDGTGEIEEKKLSNFANITESPEKLAEFITGLIGVGKCSWCIDGGNPDACPCDFGKQCLFEGDGCLEWLKQESK